MINACLSEIIALLLLLFPLYVEQEMIFFYYENASISKLLPQDSRKLFLSELYGSTAGIFFNWIIAM